MDAAALSQQDYNAALRDYLARGERRALQLGNRGPVRFTADGKIAPHIPDAHWVRCSSPRRRFPNETPFVYKPHADRGETWRWDEQAKASIRDYNLQDLSI
ncbi:MAG: hypothetical protein VW339_03955 [Quisquiliibacterium sp.]